MKANVWIIAALFLTTGSFTGCGQKEVQRPLSKVTVQLAWKHQSQFAGLYTADQRGFFAEEGLEVVLLPRKKVTDDIYAPVLDETADFGLTYGAGIIAARSKGLPVTAIATIFRIHPLVFMTLQSSGINHPYDFPGHTMRASAPGGGAYVSFQAMMIMHRLDPATVRLLKLGYDLSPFLSGEVEIWPGFITNEVQTVRKKGYTLNLILPSDYGVHFYGDTLFATDKLIRNNPDLVLRFLRAVLRGWRWAVENPEAAGTLALKYDRTLTVDQQISIMQASIPLIHTGENPIGWMRPDVWKGMHKILTEQNIISKPLELEKVYNMSFLHKIYGGRK